MKYLEAESSTVELKKEIPKNDQIIKTIIGFCNLNGGKLIIGVDNNGTIVGVDEAKIQEVLEYLDMSIYQASAPPIIPQIYAQRIGQKSILVIEVSSGMNKPYYLKTAGLEKGTYIRLGRSTMKANADMIEELKWQSRGRSFDTMPVYHATIDDLDPAKISDFTHLKKGIKQKAALLEFLQAYNLAVKEHASVYPTAAGLLLFGKDPQKFLSDAFIICSHFSGIEGRKALATRDCTGTLFEQYDRAYDFIVSSLNKSFVIEGKQRKELAEVPHDAIRELLMNAVVHRNYHITAPIKIAIFSNRIEIFSPGGFPGPLNTQNLRQGLSYIRNIALCKVLREAGYIEKLGSGFITAFASYEKHGLPAPEVLEGENYIKCILPRPNPREKKEPTASQQSSGDFARIIHLLQCATEISVSDIIQNLKIPRATAVRRLTQLQKDGVLKKIGSGKGTRYVIA